MKDVKYRLHHTESVAPPSPHWWCESTCVKIQQDIKQLTFCFRNSWNLYLILPPPWLVTSCACVMSESYHQTDLCPQWCYGAEFKYQGRVSYWNRKGLFLQAGVRVTKQPVSRFCRRGRQRGLCSLSWNVLLTLSSSKAFCVLYKNNPLFYFWGTFTQMTPTKWMSLICCVFFQ